ncbi:phosphotransferase enzyme family protein [Anaerobacillus isosaccharinicus]|uniref:Phosphotransferase n=1 Tax=Anaerobacillus isosaccharinicus TaxID=1532552 RepID=A0A1S2LPP0_9BACI|nr:phosphotransferase [Anaerobacillus isosaccharinicus]MBA5585124.1 phosphotransferase [Anaerobacillus isosaccharinicus]QOY36533.1 phosphotransferase [Anaerobacillus isosaccharinicus]
MEQNVEILFKDEVVKQGAELFNLNSSSLKKLGSFENYVFSGERDGKDCILRFTHSSHRTKQQVEAELAWLQFLQKNQAPVCGPFKSANGQLVEVISAEETFFFVSLFEKAEGNAVNVNAPEFNQKLFFAWGKATGILHRLSDEYVEKEKIIKRPDLVDEFRFQFAPSIPKDDAVQENVEKVLTRIKQLPKDKERYRLIHSDIHSGNFFFDGEKITIFDFDDCSYHHIIGDIAIPIYYSVWFNNSISDKAKFINEIFLPAFMKGFLTENPINLQLLNDIPLFLKLRDCELYGVLHKKWDLTSLNEKQVALLSEIRERIVSETPIVEVNFDNLN